MYTKKVRWEIKLPFDGIFIHSVIFVPKITGIGQLLFKLSLMVDGCTFLKHGVVKQVVKEF